MSAPAPNNVQVGSIAASSARMRSCNGLRRLAISANSSAGALRLVLGDMI